MEITSVEDEIGGGSNVQSAKLDTPPLITKEEEVDVKKEVLKITFIVIMYLHFSRDTFLSFLSLFIKYLTHL